MNSSCVSMLIISLLISSTLGERELETERNPGCVVEQCKDIDLMYSTSVDSQTNQSLFFISSIRRDKSENFGTIITQAGNITIHYSGLFADSCKDVFNYQKPKPKDSIGLIFQSLPLSVEEPKWAQSTWECSTHGEDCVIEFTGTGKDEEKIEIKTQITSDLHPYPDFPDFELSPKTLHIQISLMNIEAALLQTKNITILIVDPIEKYLSYSSDQIGLITFGSTDDDKSSPFKMIGASAEFAGWKQQATKSDGTKIPVKTSGIQEVTVDLKKLNLPVACFFDDKKVFKTFKVYEINAMLDAGETPALVNLTWPIIIGLGDNVPPSPASSGKSHALRNWSIAGAVALVLIVVGGLLYMKGRRRN